MKRNSLGLRTKLLTIPTMSCPYKNKIFIQFGILLNAGGLELNEKRLVKAISEANQRKNP